MTTSTKDHKKHMLCHQHPPNECTIELEKIRRVSPKQTSKIRSYWILPVASSNLLIKLQKKKTQILPGLHGLNNKKILSFDKCKRMYKSAKEKESEHLLHTNQNQARKPSLIPRGFKFN